MPASLLLSAWVWVALSAPAVPSDFDGDGDVDQADFGHYQVCASGEGVPPVSGCSDADLEGDGDVDEGDLALLELCARGPAVTPPADCVVTNQAPVVTVGGNKIISLGQVAVLTGEVTDDGLPDPPGALTQWWSKASGPGMVTFTPPGSANVIAQFSAAGTYVVSLFANDGALAGGATTVVTVHDASASAPLAMTTASRTSGVAPLAVFFDAVKLFNGVVQPTDGNHASLYYRWNFGDPGSGTWMATGRSRNEAVGYLAAHVFEQPGTYTVTLEVTDPEARVFRYAQDVTATAFSGTTYYVSSTAGSDANSGLSAAAAWRTFDHAMSRAATNTRILFKRGEGWTTHEEGQVNASGPGIIGAYGSGPSPRIQQLDGGKDLLELKGQDWRVMDLDLMGVGPAVSLLGRGIHRTGTDSLVLRVGMSNFYDGLINSDETRRRVAIVECSFRDNYRYGIFYSGGPAENPPPEYVAILGCALGAVVEEHLIRCYLTRSIIEENAFSDGAAGKSQLKFVGVQAPWVVEYCVISGNVFLDSGPVQWKVGLGPQNDQTDERIEHVVFERNLLLAGFDTRHMLNVWGRDVTVRNNVFDGTGGASGVLAVNVERRGIEPPPVNVSVYHNTAYRADAGGLTLCEIKPEVQDTIVRNNLLSAPPASSPQMIAGGGAGLIADHNLVLDDAGFVNAAAGDFRLTSASAAVDAGTGVAGALEDHASQPRPVDGDGDLIAEPDAGAFERQ